MKKIILLILDGFGIRESENGNAIKMASLPNLARIMSDYPVCELEASGEVVGLPKGQSGNSEACHMTIGCGRTVEQPLTLINNKIKDKSFFENDVLLDLMDFVNDNNSTLHMIGLISNANVHSSMEHFYAALALAKIRKVKSVVFHFITDGRDSLPMSGNKLISEFMAKASKLGLGTIGTICGRYYAMDRDNNYDRVKKAYDAIVYNVGNNFSDYNRCMELHYKNDITDEFINPSIITKGSNIKENDGVLFLNYRPERIRELISAFTDESFNMFNVKKFKNVRYASLYSVDNMIDVAFSQEPITGTFGRYLADLGFKQARIAESEKYPHVTYFFDGTEELSDKNLYKILVPSPKVARYDMKPEMNASEVTEAVLDAMDDDFDFILVNYANPDMLGHTGNLDATIESLKGLDELLKTVITAAEDNFYKVFILSDHGNCDEMLTPDNEKITTHSLSKVPFIITDENIKIKKEGDLTNVAPTLLKYMDIALPKGMEESKDLFYEE